MQKFTSKLFFVLSLALFSSAVYSQSASDLSEKLVIFPNPSTSGYFNIHVPGGEATTANLAVYSIIGEVIKETTVTDLSQKMQLDLSYLPEGNYFLHVNTGSGYVSRKIAIKK